MRKIVLFIFSLVAIGCMFMIRVNASVGAVSLTSATATSSGDELTVDFVVKATPSADFTATYTIAVKPFLEYYSFIYLEEDLSIQYANEITPDNKLAYTGTSEYIIQEGEISFTLVPNYTNTLYYIRMFMVIEDGCDLNGDVTERFTLSGNNQGDPIQPTVDSVFTTTASITMNNSSGKGTVDGNISFSENTYQTGWYAIDLNYIKEYFGFKVNISEAAVTSNDNSQLNSAMSGSVNIDEGGNIVYFALPALNNITSTINYHVTFGEAASGYNNNDVGSRVKIIRITNNTNTQAMAFSLEDYSYVVSVDDPKTIEQIINACGIRAYDHRDGEKEISYTDTNNYATKVTSVNDVKSRTLGNYNVSLSASDDKNNNASLIVKLMVKDVASPVINTDASTLLYERSYNDALLSDEAIISGIVASDNYYDNEDLIVTVDTDAYKAGYASVDNYNVLVSVSDPSGNISESNIVIRVVDLVAPIISGASSFSTSYTSDISAWEIVEKCGIEAVDELDGIVELTITYDSYTANKHTPGNYTITVSAVDSSSNQASFTINVTVTDNITPYFLVNKTTLIVENGYAYTPSEILSTAISSGLIRLDYTNVEVVTDEYTNNETTEGEYLYRLRVTYAEGVEYVDINLKVINNKNDVTKVKWYVKIGNFFAKPLKKVGNFMTNTVYEKGIKKVFSFVKNLWNKVFRR